MIKPNLPRATQPWSTWLPATLVFLSECLHCYHGCATEKAAVTLSLPPHVIKAAFLFFFFSCVILHSLIFKKIFYWKTTAPDTHKHNGMSTSAGFSTCLPAFRHPSSSSSFPPSKCLFVFQGSKTNATFSTKVSSTSKIKLFAVSLFPFYTHLSSNTSQKY